MAIDKRLDGDLASGASLGAEAKAGQEKLDPASSPAPPNTDAQPPPAADETKRSELPPLFAADPPKSKRASTQPEMPTSRQLAIYASGLVFVVVAAAVAGAWMLLGPSSSHKSGKLDVGVVAPALGSFTACPLQPMTTASGQNDGRLPLQADAAGLIEADIASFMLIGKTAAAADRPRDAEVAFLMSCRVADKLKGGGSAESADAKYQLGAHYAALALGGVSAAERAELLGRAERLYADSAQVYVASYGQAHEKSQLAAGGLAAARQALAQARLPPQTVTTAAAPPLEIRSEGLEKPAPRALPGAAAAPVASPVPQAQAQGKIRPHSPIFKECPPAVATLGLCDPGT